MEIKNTYPPNYDLIKYHFPKCEGLKAVFTYGDTIFNPFEQNISPDLEKHEEVHSKRQAESPDLWWHNYITSKDFRLNEELIAYASQYRFAIETLGSSKLTDWLLEKCAEALSGDLYDLGLSFGEAKSKIRRLSRNSV